MAIILGGARIFAVRGQRGGKAKGYPGACEGSWGEGRGHGRGCPPRLESPMQVTDLLNRYCWYLHRPGEQLVSGMLAGLPCVVEINGLDLRIHSCQPIQSSPIRHKHTRPSVTQAHYSNFTNFIFFQFTNFYLF